MFSSLHCHTEHSNLRLSDCICSVSELINSAHRKGYKSVCLTEHESLSSHITGIETMKKINKTDESFKVLLGNEIYLTEKREKKQKYYHFLLIAKDLIGHKQLRQLSSEAWQNSYHDRRMERVVTLKSDIEKIIGGDRGHVIASTACLGSEFSELVLTHLQSPSETTRENIHEFVSWCLNIFNEDFYIEIQPGATLEQTEYNKMAVNIAKAYGINFIVTNDVHYINKEDRPIHASYLNSKDGDRELDMFYESTYMHSEEEMLDKLKYLGDNAKIAIENTIKIHDKCEKIDLYQEITVPEIVVPEVSLSHIFKDWYQECEFIKRHAESDNNQDRWLLYNIEKGFIERNQEFNEINVKRINTELREIWLVGEQLKQKMSSYYNLVQKVVDIIWDDNLGNSIVGVGRGSSVGYYICYLIGITQISPIKYNLPHWRHLNAERASMIDIDIDSEMSKRERILFSLKKVFGYENVLPIITFKTEGSKSAIGTACRGLKIDIDESQTLSDMIPSARGKLWTISECLYGNDEDKKPVKEFAKMIDSYPHLKETALKIEGLICGRSSHASGIYIYNNGFIEQNSMMRTPSGQPVTCWSMNNSDYVGGLKLDSLTVEALDKIRTTLTLLLENNVIEWQGSLKKTYNKYLHPDVLEYNDPELWKLMSEHKVIDIFQYDTMVGVQTVDKIHPQNVIEMSTGNSLMRLMSENGESLLDKYARFKKNIDEWYTEMRENKLNEEEIEILKNQLSIDYGISSQQENSMLLVMDKGISGFSLFQADTLRKAIAKKKPEIMQEIKELFYQKGEEIGTRTVLLDYVWNYCIMPQAGYSFSALHSTAYSVIGLQELNLVYRYGQIFWNCACLTVNSGYLDEEEEYTEEDLVTATEETSGEESEETETKEKIKSKNKTVKYGKIAKAICDIQLRDVKMFLPDINKAKMEFSPDLEREGIVFGMKSISGIGEDLIKQIIEKRPFSSLIDFLERVDITAVQVLNLVKSGSFDEIESKDRKKWCIKSLFYIFSKNTPPKTKLTMQNFAKMMDMDFLPEEKKIYGRYYNYRKYISLPEFKAQDGYVKLDEKAQQFYYNEFKNPDLIVNSSDGVYLNFKGFEKIYKKKMDDLKDWLADKETLDKFNEAVYNKEVDEMMEKYCEGSIQQWEMSALNFYYSGHELAGIDKAHYGLTDFSLLPEEPVYTVTTNKNGKEFKKYELNKICGTVIDVNKTRHIVYLLTEDGVVNLKFYDGAFVHYNKQISTVGKDGKKTVLEKSWFKRGTKLFVVGFRRGDYFHPRKYFNSVYQHTVSRINNLDETGRVDLQFERIRL